MLPEATGCAAGGASLHAALALLAGLALWPRRRQTG
jgi:uncharacterized protein (TIGR03382 family)